MNNNVTMSVFRHWDLTKIIDYIVVNQLTMHRFELKDDWITIEVSGDSYMDVGLFEEYIAELEFSFDKELGLV